MGEVQSNLSQPGETYTQLPSSRSGLVILFYNKRSPFKTDPLVIPLDSPVSYEQALIKGVEHLSEDLGRYFPRHSEKVIGPLLLPLFGLYAKDHSLQQWVPDWHVFDGRHARQEYYLRVKVQLPAAKDFAKKIPRGVFTDYLFWQIADDFFSGRLWDHFGEGNNITTIDAVNFNALNIFMAAAQYRLHDVVTRDPEKVLHTPLKNLTTLPYVLKKVRFWNLNRLFPEKMSAELQREYNIRPHRDPFLRYISYSFMKKYIRQFFEINGDQTVGDLRLIFVDSLINEYVTSYGKEFFKAAKVTAPNLPGPPPVDLTIRPFRDGSTPGLYFNTSLKAPLGDILRVFISHEADTRAEQKRILHVEYRNERPMILQMESQQLAESVVSVLSAVCQLRLNYLSTPVDDHLRAPSLRVLNMLGSYGPLDEETARNYLRSREKDAGRDPDLPQYLLYQDCQQFGLLHVLGTEVNSHALTGCLLRFKAKDNGFLFSLHESETSEKAFYERSCPKEIIMKLKELYGQRIVPKEDELSGAMVYLKDNEDVRYYSDIDETGPGERRTQEKDSTTPVLYREEEIPVRDKSPIARGQFCEVYQFTQLDQERLAVLKKVTSSDQHVQDAYRRGMDQLMKLSEGCHYFIRVYGQVVKSPLRFVLESMPPGKGSLLDRLRHESGVPWIYISSVLYQLAMCLDYLSKNGVLYGSFRCSKILIRSENGLDQDNPLVIRLGDPGMAMLCDTLRLDHKLNEERLAWVAPERLENLKQHTVASEVFALGTTIWEMLARGKHPNNCLENTSPLEFFTSKKKLSFNFLGVSPTEEVYQLPFEPGVAKAGQWIVSQNFEGADAHQTAPSGGDHGSEEEETAQDSQASGDAPAYVKGANVSGGSAPGGSQAGGEGQGGNSEQESEANRLWKDLEMDVVNFVYACWHHDPSLRPSPTQILRKACVVKKKVYNVLAVDPYWQESLNQAQALEAGNVKDADTAQRAKLALQSGVHVRHVSDKEEEEERERMRIQMEEARKNLRCSILVSRLDFSKSTSLGKGNFGTVKTALLKEESETREEGRHCATERVAVKELNTEKCTPQNVVQFLKEAQCIYKLEHSNIVKLMGIVFRGERNPDMLILEYADTGSLEKYVNTNQQRLGTLSFKKILKNLATHISKGMQYVGEQERVHGDLAARNVVLFSADGKGNLPLTAKLCDFGLSHQLVRGYYHLGRSSVKDPQIPAYLLPPELLRGWNTKEVKFTVKSDVWAFGIFLWEIFSNKKPETVLGTDPGKILQRLNSERHPLPRPDNCSARSGLYEVMLKCWASEAEDRPGFDSLAQMLEELTDQDLD